MRALTFVGYGGRDKLELRDDLEKPSAGPGEVLLRVRAAGLTPLDWKLRSGMLRFVWPLKFPFTPGFEVAGVVDSVGEGVTDWKVGDALYAGPTKGGGHAEYISLDPRFCVAKPESLSFEEAAAVPVAALSALQSLRKIGRLGSGEHVIVNGASGGVGSCAVQIAKALGCRVTAVTSSRNVDLVDSLGADAVIDYTAEDVRQAGPCDVFFDVVPNRSFRSTAAMLSARGTYVTTLPGLNPLAWKMLTTAGRLVGYRKRCGMLMLKENQDDLTFVNSLIEDGKLRIVIDSTYSLDEVHSAHEKSEAGHARGKIVLRIS